MNEFQSKHHVHKGEKPLDKRLMNEINKVHLEQIVVRITQSQTKYLREEMLELLESHL